MKLAHVYRSIVLQGRTRTLQCCYFQSDIVSQDLKSKPVKYKYPDSYDPYGPKPAPSDKIVQLAERIVSLTSEERSEIGPALGQKMILPMLKHIAVEGAALAPKGGGAGPGSAKVEDKKAEKTTFDVKLEKFDAGAKLKIIKEIRSFTDLGLKEAKDLVEKAPVVLKQQITKDEANSIIEKIKAVGGVAVME